MNSDKLGLTLFDILGYLLPGYILLFSVSIIEATFLGSGFLSLVNIEKSFLFCTIAAYYGGHLCHILSSLIKDKFFKHLGQEYRQKSPIYKRFKTAVIDTFKLDPKEDMESLDLYLLADSYIVAAGMSEERNSLLVREGFYKTATTSFGVMLITMFSSIFVGGIKLRLDPGVIQTLGIIPTIVFAAITLIVFFLFANRFSFYNRMKLQNTYNLFLAVIEREKIK